MSLFIKLQERMKVAKTQIGRAIKDGNDVDGGLREGITADTVKFRAEMAHNLLIRSDSDLMVMDNYAILQADGEMGGYLTTSIFNIARSLGTAGDMQFVDFLARFWQHMSAVVAARHAIDRLPDELHRDNKKPPALRPAFQEIVKLMETAGALGTLRMECWNTSGRLAENQLGVEKLHECGNRACLAGHVRISPYFNSILNFIPRHPSPVAITTAGQVQTAELMSVLLNVPLWFACLMIYENDWYPGGKHPPVPSSLGGSDSKEVLSILYRLRDGESAERIYLSFRDSGK